jgi:hypothetical protein
MTAYLFDGRYGVAQYTGVAAEYLEEPTRGARAVGMTTTVNVETPHVDEMQRIDASRGDRGTVQRLHSHGFDDFDGEVEVRRQS